MNDSRAHYLPYYIVIGINVCRREKAAQNGPVFNCMKFLDTNQYAYAYMRRDERKLYTHNYYNSGTYYAGNTFIGTDTKFSYAEYSVKYKNHNIYLYTGDSFPLYASSKIDKYSYTAFTDTTASPVYFYVYFDWKTYYINNTWYFYHNENGMTYRYSITAKVLNEDTGGYSFYGCILGPTRVHTTDGYYVYVGSNYSNGVKWARPGTIKYTSTRIYNLIYPDTFDHITWTIERGYTTYRNMPCGYSVYNHYTSYNKYGAYYIYYYYGPFTSNYYIYTRSYLYK